MEETSNTSGELDHLCRRLGHRRGQITKLRNKVQDMQAAHPDTFDLILIDELFADLHTQVSVIEDLQEKIDFIYEEYPDLAIDEEPEKDRLDDAHKALKCTLLTLKKAGPLSHDCNVLLGQIQEAASKPQPESPRFCALVDSLRSRLTAISSATGPLLCSVTHLAARCKELDAVMSELQQAIWTEDRPVSPLPTPIHSPPTVAPYFSNSSLHLDVPRFDGNPYIKWSNFEVMFRATIKSRARGHSNLEVKGHLINEGLQILHNLPDPDASLDEMLDALEAKFGATDILGPLIINKISSVCNFDLSSSNLDNIYDNMCLPFQKFIFLVGNNLSNYLALSAIGMMSPECKREWLRFKPTNSMPAMDSILKFVQYWRKELGTLKTASTSTLPSSSGPYRAAARSSSPTRSKGASAFKPAPRRQQTNCPACNEQHTLSRCTTFAAFDMDKRNQFIREKRLCLNCLADGHGCRQCPSKFFCRKCQGRHHTLLHRGKDATPATASTPLSPVMTTTSQPGKSRQAKSLYSAVVVLRHGGRTVHARALLDGGAAIPLITEKLATDLQLPRTHDPTTVAGIAGTTQCKFTVSTAINSMDEKFESEPISFTVIPSLDSLNTPQNRSQLLRNPLLRHYNLADPDLGGRVDLVLCIDQTSDLTTGTPLLIGELRALPTQLGLCLSAPLSGTPPTPVMTATTHTNLQEDLGRLWELDRVPEAPSISKEEEEAVVQFGETVNRVGNRFAVSLPRVQSPPKLGDTRRQALSRFYANEKSMAAKDKLEDFNHVLQEYQDLGHSETVPFHELQNTDVCYLPVHAVVKETSSSTKLRAVFDASARSKSGASLNDMLLPGPSLYPPLTDILTRFRCHTIGISADIKKMFREILLNDSEKDWHRFLARNSSGKIEDRRMLCLTFGIKSSPFLATQVLRILANTYESSHPRAALAIREEFYMDDVLSGADSNEAALDLHKELLDLLSRAGMHLRKWRSNSSQLKEKILPELLEKDSASLSIEPSPDAQKALGVHWDTSADTLHVSVPQLTSLKSPTTKRVIASGTAGIFDVLGLFSPFVVSARILFQDTWKLGLAWDADTPEDIQERWKGWMEDLPLINQHPIPRRLTTSPPNSTRSLHGFCDASSVAYGAVVYLRTQPPEGPAQTAIVIAKARGLPTKGITIPKAELSAAHLLATLLSHTQALLKIPANDLHAWTDSQIVLHWLPKSPSALNRFVANRVAAIQELTPPQIWRHVPSA